MNKRELLSALLGAFIAFCSVILFNTNIDDKSIVNLSKGSPPEAYNPHDDLSIIRDGSKSKDSAGYNGYNNDEGSTYFDLFKDVIPFPQQSPIVLYNVHSENNDRPNIGWVV